MNENLKAEILSLFESADLTLTLSDATMQDSIRRNRPYFREMLDEAMQNGGFPKNRVTEMLDERVGDYRTELREHLATLVGKARILRTAVQFDNGSKVETGLQHFQFEDLLVTLQCGLNAYLVGPAGSGKTTAAEQVAKTLNLPFYFTGAITSEFKLTGFIDAQGRIVCPAFRKAYEKGGVFLFDEIDASMPQAVLAFNAAIANGMMDFPDKTVTKHKDFYCIAAANTYGLGADRVYVGRNQMDGATIDRFAFIDWSYDETLERTLAGNDEWVDYVQAVRKAAAEHKIRHVVSPRASIQGAKLLAQKVKREKVEALVLWKGCEAEAQKKLKAAAAQYIKAKPMLEPEQESAPTPASATLPSSTLPINPTTPMTEQPDGSYVKDGKTYRRLNRSEYIQSIDIHHDNKGAGWVRVPSYLVGRPNFDYASRPVYRPL